ncbi:MAG TPA: helix-turn-helix domain-containing protein, partial [Streptosporangiaceae bacterium]|nr:helix-turn-helix domain-containing protein [Streptosporangiaceae bacterium]
MFETLGVSPDAERAYLALLDRPAGTQQELSAVLKWPAAKTRRVLGALGAHGLVALQEAQPVRYAAVAPDVAIQSLAQRQIDGARRVQYEVPALMERFWSQRTEERAQDFIEVVTPTAEVIIRRTHQLQYAARVRIRAFDRPPYMTDPSVVNTVELETLDHGITYQIIYDQAYVGWPGRWADFEAGLAAGEQCRVLPDLPVKLTIFDDWAATITTAATAPDSLPLMIVVHQSPVLDALAALFDAYWTRAIPLTVPSLAVRDRPDSAAAREDRLVSMLAAGLGDDAIRRNLGVSASTVQRSITGLMRRVGATTRFQAGMQIARGRAESLRHRAAGGRARRYRSSG